MASPAELVHPNRTVMPRMTLVTGGAGFGLSRGVLILDCFFCTRLSVCDPTCPGLPDGEDLVFVGVEPSIYGDL